MERRTFPWLVGLLAFVAIAAAAAWWAQRTPAPIEVAVVTIPVAGGPETVDAEISGLAWFGDRLVMMPQYPDVHPVDDGRGAVFVLERRAIEAFIDGEVSGPLEARRVPLDAPGLTEVFPGFDGFESIAFAGSSVFVTVETRRDEDETVGWLLAGRVVGDLEAVVIDPARRQRLPAQNDLPNTGFEAIVVHGDRVLAIYETNGSVNPRPRALVFGHDLEPLGELPLVPLEYRVTDATTADDRGHFWVANYHWPGAPWQPGTCALTEEYGQGESHASCRTVERLVELQVTDEGIRPTRRAPLLLELLGDELARNWEGVVRMPGRGFLLATDEYPTSILAFVPFED